MRAQDIPEEESMTKSNIVDATAALAVYREKGLQLPEKVEATLARSGFNSPVLMAEAVAVAICAGMDPAYLDRPENIVVLAQAHRAVRDYAAMPGVHFYLTPYDIKEKRGNDWIVVGKKYSFVPSINWLDASVRAQGRMDGISYLLDTKIVTGDKLNEMMREHAPHGWDPSPNDRGALARFIPIHIRTGNRLMEPDYQFGYYLGSGYWKEEYGKRKLVNPDAGQPANLPNNTPQDKAKRRAVKAAAREITREFSDLNPNKTQEERMAIFARMAYERAVDMDVENLRRNLPPDAEDILIDDDGEDYVDGDAIEVHPDPAAVDAAPAAQEIAGANDGATDSGEDGEDVTWGDLNLIVRKAMTGDQRDTVDALYDAKDGAAAKASTVTQMRAWIKQAAQGDEQIGIGPDHKPVSFSDFIFYALLGLEFGELPRAKQAQVFYPLFAAAQGKGWTYSDDLDGPALVRVVRGALAEVTSVAETF
jgi:hypothetical protein